MPMPPNPWRWVLGPASLLACLLMLSCAAPPEVPTPGTWGGRPFGTPPAPNPALKRSIVNRATREWEYFDRQTVVFHGDEESIPHVGAWEDDNGRYSSRVNLYWRAVGKPGIDGVDCREPWSAAFMSWVMQGSGVPESQFPGASAHWIYLSELVDQAPYPGRWFVPRRVSDYSPQPGDLVCASRAGSRPRMINGYLSPGGLEGVKAHCDLVVQNNGDTLDVIGGNVRNSVSRSTFELDSQGHLKTVRRRPWFVILQNRL